MQYLVSAAEMKAYDSNTINRIGIPACVLMERAALAAVRAVEEYCAGLGGEPSVLVAAGMGNNGGDGLAAARLLSEKGYRVDVWCVGEESRASEQFRQQRRILDYYPAGFVREPEDHSYTVIIDALFGVGLSREVRGIFQGAVERIQSLAGWKLSLDLPSGIDSDTGKILGCAVRADMTVTFGFCKRGLVLYPGKDYAGEVQIADIGISQKSFFGQEPEMFFYDEAPHLLMPGRDGNGNKGTFGKVLLAAGSMNMAGAAILAARAAYRAGAGMVKVISAGENREILQQAVPEALFGTGKDLESSLSWADVIAVGPGIGQGQEALDCLERCIREGEKPLLIDADGLNLLSLHPSLREILAGQGKAGREIILTPHVGELARLRGKNIGACKDALSVEGMALASALHCAVAAKDARTFICREGERICVNISGNSGMATAGSGDVLTGIIAGLLAQRMKSFEAAAVGVYVHGCAGDLAAGDKGEHACMAGDIIDKIGKETF